MRYAILIYSNPESRRIWEGLPGPERAEGLAAYAALNGELAATGELIVAEALAEPSRALRVTARAGSTLQTDGPFAELKEQLAGFYLVECTCRQRAVEIAGRVPEAAFGLVEVRPVQSLEELGEWDSTTG